MNKRKRGILQPEGPGGFAERQAYIEGMILRDKNGKVICVYNTIPGEQQLRNEALATRDPK